MSEGKGKYGHLDGMLNTACNTYFTSIVIAKLICNSIMFLSVKMSKDIEVSKDPSTSLQWYKEYLGTVISMEELFTGLCQFYDELDRNGVPHN